MFGPFRVVELGNVRSPLTRVKAPSADRTGRIELDRASLPSWLQCNKKSPR